MAFSKAARKKAHSPAARRKAMRTMKKNGTGPFRNKKPTQSIPLAAIGTRRPKAERIARRKPVEPQFETTLIGRIAAAHGLAKRIAELLS